MISNKDCINSFPIASHLDLTVSNFSDPLVSEKINELANEKINAEKIFTSLGKNWWKQIFDGKYHQFGPMVFDQCLHWKEREEGFYDNAYNAFQFAKKHLCEPLTTDFYLELHKIACAHFQGKKTNTADQDDVGRFRSFIAPRSSFDFTDILRINSNLSEKILLEYSIVKDNYCRLKNDGVEETIKFLNKTKQINEITASEFNKLDNILINKIACFERYTDSLKTTNGEKTIPDIKVLNHLNRIDLHYPSISSLQIKNSVQDFIQIFNEKIANMRLNSLEEEKIKDEKLVAIADLFQKLEFLHPFKDGQGRTDLILLSKLLTENGFSPAILHEPYASSGVSLDEWCKYLKNGMLDWHKEVSSS